MSEPTDELLNDQSDPRYGAMRSLAFAERIVPPELLVRDGIKIDELVSATEFGDFCREHPVPQLQLAARRLVEQGAVGASRVAYFTADSLRDVVFLREVLDNLSDVTLSALLRLKRRHPTMNISAVAQQRQYEVTERAASLALDRAAGVACGFLAIENSEFEKLVDRRRALDACQCCVGVPRSKQARKRLAKTNAYLWRMLSRLRYLMMLPDDWLVSPVEEAMARDIDKEESVALRKPTVVYDMKRCSLIIDRRARDDELNEIERRLLLCCALEEARMPKLGSVSDSILLRSGYGDHKTTALSAYRNLLRKMKERKLTFDLRGVLIRERGNIRIRPNVTVIRTKSIFSHMPMEDAAEMMLSKAADESDPLDKYDESH
ncbi:MAG TPA: hypothetical protein VGP72_26975 [Planctomycetota bacterium]|jgi:hypothetical protein